MSVQVGITPKKGLKGLVENWQSDLLAALSVSLVALPLALGIAVASGVPPMSGILSAIVGGIVTTIFRGSYLAINGPAAGLIAVILTSLSALDDNSGHALNYVLAAIVISGALQILFGLLKLGRYADIFHSSVIRGILAAIGVIIIANQIHVAFGTHSNADTVIDRLYDAVLMIPEINPFVAIISLSGLVLLIFHSRISYKLFHFLPAPMWVLIISLPFVYAFNFFEDHDMYLFDRVYAVGPALLLDIPNNIFDAILYPDFSKIDTWPFWSSVLSITMISSIESLASSKAVDKLDPYKRRTNLNKDLIGIGASTMVSGLLGGLPIITVIVRSTVNVHNNAKTKWSNLYHGILLLIFVLLLTPVLQQVPLCALAIILVFTGFKLASPKVLLQIYNQGIEQPIFFIGTLLITLKSDLLNGIFGGLALAVLVHFLLAKVPPHTFFKMIYKSGSNLFIKKDGTYELKIKGIANFLAAVHIDNLLIQVPPESVLNIDLTEARIVDFSILEHLYDFQKNMSNEGGQVEITGLERHISSANHKFALKLLLSSPDELSPRQVTLKEMAREYDWTFENVPNEQIEHFETFYFFKSRQVRSKSNSLSGKDDGINWEITDISFEEGAYMASEAYHTTLGLIQLPFNIPKFTIEKKGILSKYIDLPGHRDIDYVIYNDFSKEFEVKVEDKDEMKGFINNEIRSLIEDSDIHHLESDGEAILIFNDRLRLAKILEYSKIIKFSEDLRDLIKKSKPRLDT